tara:strand:- start:903 stop:1115 length:213 start_codon:yes stop_codon:yes gene_type:complete
MQVLSKYYGCGLTIPKDFSNLKGLRILDLGSGSGRDCYILSRLVGESGYAINILCLRMIFEILDILNSDF